MTNFGSAGQVKPGPLSSTDRAALDNQWATYFLIDPTSGFAPARWQQQVGPVVLFRPGGAAISIKEVCCMHGFLDQLLDAFGDVARGALRHRMTPQHFGRFAASFKRSTMRLDLTEGRCIVIQTSLQRLWQRWLRSGFARWCSLEILRSLFYVQEMIV